MNSDTTQVEILGEGVELHWMYHRQLMVFKISNVHRSTIDIWGDAFIEVIKKWPVEKPLLSVHDFSATSNAALTPYIRSKAQTFSHIRMEIVGRTAVVLPKSIISQAVALFLRTVRHLQHDRNVFFTCEDALAWVAKGLPPEK